MMSELPDLPDWRVVSDQIEVIFEAGNFTAAGEFAARIALLADEANHHPDIDIRYPGVVTVVLTTHESGSLTDLDTDLAARISKLATEAGVKAVTGGRR